MKISKEDLICGAVTGICSLIALNIGEKLGRQRQLKEDKMALAGTEDYLKELQTMFGKELEKELNSIHTNLNLDYAGKEEIKNRHDDIE